MGRKLPANLLALGRQPFPASVAIGGNEYRLKQPFKHDFFAATARYDGSAGRIVLKIGRRAHFLGIPLAWIGRFLARREAEFYRRLAGLDCVPRLVGTWGNDAIAHEYIDGRPLGKGHPVPDDYFDRLRLALAVMHSRDMAYVDLEKCENVLVGDDGRPYLFDFQIAWFLPCRWGGQLRPARWLLRSLQHADLYHLRKLQRQVRPDQMTREELAESYRRPWYVRIHGWLAAPGQRVRRGVLRYFARSRGGTERGRLDSNAGSSCAGDAGRRIASMPTETKVTPTTLR